MEKIKNHLWNKNPGAEVQLGVVQMRGAAMWRHQIKGFKFVFGGTVPALLITVGKAKQIKDCDRNG